MPKLKTASAEPVTAGDLRQGGTARELLFSTVERYERLQEEKEAIGADQKEVMDEAKSRGLDTAIIRKVIMRRRHDKADVMEQDELVELYEQTVDAMEQAALEQSKKDGE